MSIIGENTLTQWLWWIKYSVWDGMRGWWSAVIGHVISPFPSLCLSVSPPTSLDYFSIEDTANRREAQRLSEMFWCLVEDELMISSMILMKAINRCVETCWWTGTAKIQLCLIWKLQMLAYRWVNVLAYFHVAKVSEKYPLYVNKRVNSEG